MSKRTWYVIALLLLTGACLPVTGPEEVKFTPSVSDQPGGQQDEGRQPNRKLDP